jgi:hypothetical protein
MAVPESATDVFDVNAITGNGTSDRAINTGFVTDVHLSMRRSSNYPTIVDRLRGHGSGSTKRLATHVTNAEQSLTGNYWLGLDTNDGYILSSDYENQSSQTYVQYAWKRSPNYFDVVAYTGSSTAGTLTVNHNLAAKPELIIAKARSAAQHWNVLFDFTSTGEKYFAVIGTSGAAAGGAEVTYGSGLLNSEPTDSAFVVRTDTGIGRAQDYIAYLFASLDGVSKVFSVTKSSGSDASVNCGFSAGPRFVLLKRTDSTGDWYVWDSERGIVAGNDPYLLLNSTAAEVTSTDYIDPTSNGFTIVNGGLADGDYIGYSVA